MATENCNLRYDLRIDSARIPWTNFVLSVGRRSLPERIHKTRLTSIDKTEWTTRTMVLDMTKRLRLRILPRSQGPPTRRWIGSRTWRLDCRGKPPGYVYSGALYHIVSCMSRKATTRGMSSRVLHPSKYCIYSSILPFIYYHCQGEERSHAVSTGALHSGVKVVELRVTSLNSSAIGFIVVLALLFVLTIDHGL